MDKLKAYAVHDNHEGYGTVVFSTNGAAARRNGASDLGCEWEDIESCRRTPQFDQYAPGPVPPLMLIEDGWWFECSHCGRRVSSDMADELESEGLDPDNFEPRPAGKRGVYCSEGCECRNHLNKSYEEEATDALRQVFEAKFPGAEILFIRATTDGPKLTVYSTVTFRFPGSAYPVSWEFGDEFCRVQQCDVEAFNAWRNEAERGER